MAFSSSTASGANVEATSSGSAETMFSATTEGFKAAKVVVVNRSSNNLFINVSPIHAAGDFFQLPANSSQEFRYLGQGGSGQRGVISSVTVYASVDPSAASFAVVEV